jgi:2-polyprenyl-3-methyl-5-hydroxy-6-metoxy-1,4-benzoquinol methylase
MKESDIRPQDLLDRYVELSAQDAEYCFADGRRDDTPCVACGSVEVVSQFVKSGFAYAQCIQCGTLYQTPRPLPEAFEAFYRNSASSRYWAEVFFPAVAEARREKIFRPRVARLRKWCEERGVPIHRLVDVGAGFGIFLDEWRRCDPAVKAFAVEPSAHLAAECRAKGFDVVEDVAENLTGMDACADMVTCFEVLEHVTDPLSFVLSLKRLVRPGGILFVSTLSIDGFDLQVLWDRSTQISPPHHINFLSIEGFRKLFERAGLVDVDISTPGQLDVDIVRNAATKNGDLLKPQRFVRALLTDDVAKGFQTFLAQNRLSSHAWVLGVVPG